MKTRLKHKKKIGLVLSGGGFKAAAFHIGVCLALKEKGFRFAGGTKEQVQRSFDLDDPKVIRTYVGSSAGAFVAAILASGYSVEALVNAFEVGLGNKPFYNNHSLDYLKPIGYRDIFQLNSKNILRSIPLALAQKSIFKGGLEALLKERFKINGFCKTSGVEEYLREYAFSHNQFQQLGVNLYIVGTRLNQAKKVIFGTFSDLKSPDPTTFVEYATISQAVAASTSLPPVFSPYGIKNQDGELIHYFDGEIRDTLSTHVAADLGADLVISSYSVQPYEYTEEIGSLHQFGIPAIINQALYQVIQQKIERAISYKSDIRAIYNAIDGYFKQNKLPDEHREKILEIIRNRVNYKPNVDYIYIAPRPHDYEMFFADHFSLSPKVLEKIVWFGFKSALNQLRHYEI